MNQGNTKTMSKPLQLGEFEADGSVKTSSLMESKQMEAASTTFPSANSTVVSLDAVGTVQRRVSKDSVDMTMEEAELIDNELNEKTQAADEADHQSQWGSGVTTVTGFWRRRRRRRTTTTTTAYHCNPAIPDVTTTGRQAFIDQVRKCGELQNLCPTLPVVEANTDYPMAGDEVLATRNYIVQFDMHYDESGQAVNEDTCLEVIVSGFSNWESLGMEGMEASFNHMGACGRGDNVDAQALTIAGKISRDCLKHDTCVAALTVFKGNEDGTIAQSDIPDGFCNEPQCGDEGAQAVWLGSSDPRYALMSWTFRGNCDQWFGDDANNGLPEK